ncbi:transaldolase [bacterium]|nr:transaldolase [bacterium]
MGNDLKIDIYADGANIKGIKEAKNNSLIKGFTTNPTLMRNSGIEDYKNFAQEALEIVGTSPISFEVFSDDLDEMYKQAKEISSWGSNISVKIPITNTLGKSTSTLVSSLSKENVFCNVTAIFTDNQVEEMIEASSNNCKMILSVFAGRIADTGIDPIPAMKSYVEKVSLKENIKILWASPREALNIVQANDIGCDIITVTDDLLKKVSSFNKDLSQFSLETVKMFYNDAQKSGYTI